jgi:hypothetical protein
MNGFRIRLAPGELTAIDEMLYYASLATQDAFTTA